MLVESGTFEISNLALWPVSLWISGACDTSTTVLWRAVEVVWGECLDTDAAGVTERGDDDCCWSLAATEGLLGDDDGCWSLAVTEGSPESIMLVLAELSLVSTSTTWVKSIWQVRPTERSMQMTFHIFKHSVLDRKLQWVLVLMRHLHSQRHWIQQRASRNPCFRQWCDHSDRAMWDSGSNQNHNYFIK